MKHNKIFVGSNGKVTQRRFNLIDLAVQKAKEQIMAQEDADIFAAIDSGNKEE